MSRASRSKGCVTLTLSRAGAPPSSAFPRSAAAHLAALLLPLLLVLLRALCRYAKQGFRQSKEIKELSARVKSLERTLSTSVQTFEKEKDAIAKEDQRRISEVELDSAGLRQLVRLKTKEVSHMKRLAAIILQKRNEVETFLLDSIEFVKAEIGRRGAEEERAMPRSRGRLPALGASKPSNLPASAEEHIDIRDLTWDDRERVLRLLFAKINNAAPFPQMPPHPLHDEPPPRGDPGSGELPGSPGDLTSAEAAFFVTQAEQA